MIFTIGAVVSLAVGYIAGGHISLWFIIHLVVLSVLIDGLFMSAIGWGE